MLGVEFCALVGFILWVEPLLGWGTKGLLTRLGHAILSRIYPGGMLGVEFCALVGLILWVEPLLG